MKENSHNSATAFAPLNQLGRVPVRRVDDPARHAAPYLLTLHVGGKRKRSFHATEKAAIHAWKEHKRLEKKFGTLPYLFDADAQRDYDSAIRLLRGRASVMEAARFYVDHAPTATAPALGVAAADFVATKERLARAHDHVRTLKYGLAAFSKQVPGQSVATITAKDVRAYCLAPGIASRTSQNRRNTLASFFAWCVRQGWITRSPVADLIDADMPSPDRKPKVVLTPAQASALFSAIQAREPECAPWFAIQAFAGIRDAEASRLDSSMIDREARRIRIPASICKTADDWVLAKLPENVWGWLPDPCRFIAPPARRWARLLRDLGNLPFDNPARLPAWPFNALRRSFCTYHITLHGDATRTASLLRHTSPARLYASYLGALRTEAEARAYFSITPDNLPTTP